MGFIDKIERIKEKAVLIGVVSQGQTEREISEYLDELAFLAETAGAIPLKRFVQKLEAPNPKTFLGSGKIAEVEEFIKDNEARSCNF